MWITRRLLAILIIPGQLYCFTNAFATNGIKKMQRHPKTVPRVVNAPTRTRDTSLQVLLDVPDGFFTVTFASLGILLSISRTFVRVRMEEMAWEQRLEEGRKERLRRDPTITELDLRRKEAAMEWSAYGKPRMEEENFEREIRQGKRRVKVMEREDDDGSEFKMSEDEIAAFEAEYGIDYDPYYDDPYLEDELPIGKFTVNKRYGDRIYENGEIFYKDSQTGMYYRQGAKPRNLSFFS